MTRQIGAGKKRRHRRVGEMTVFRFWMVTQPTRHDATEMRAEQLSIVVGHLFAYF